MALGVPDQELTNSHAPARSDLEAPGRLCASSAGGRCAAGDARLDCQRAGPHGRAVEEDVPIEVAFAGGHPLPDCRCDRPLSAVPLTTPAPRRDCEWRVAVQDARRLDREPGGALERNRLRREW